MDILAIESSCDETAAAVIRDGREIISSVVATQIEEHKLYGGVVPEIASRRHCESIVAVVDEALQKAGMKAQDVDAIAVSYAPGLIGALLVGVNFARGLRCRWISRLSRCTTFAGTSRRITWLTRSLNLRTSAWWPPGLTAIL